MTGAAASALHGRNLGRRRHRDRVPLGLHPARRAAPSLATSAHRRRRDHPCRQAHRRRQSSHVRHLDLGRFPATHQAPAERLVTRADARVPVFDRGRPDPRQALPATCGGPGSKPCCCWHDGVAASPPETRLRLLYIDAGPPRPTTRIAIADERVGKSWDLARWRLAGRSPEVALEATVAGAPDRTGGSRAAVSDLRVLPKLAQLDGCHASGDREDRGADVVQRSLPRTPRGWDLQRL